MNTIVECGPIIISVNIKDITTNEISSPKKCWNIKTNSKHGGWGMRNKSTSINASRVQIPTLINHM